MREKQHMSSASIPFTVTSTLHNKNHSKSISRWKSIFSYTVVGIFPYTDSTIEVGRSRELHVCFGQRPEKKRGVEAKQTNKERRWGKEHFLISQWLKTVKVPSFHRTPCQVACKAVIFPTAFSVEKGSGHSSGSCRPASGKSFLDGCMLGHKNPLTMFFRGGENLEAEIP